DGIRDYKVTGVQTCALPIYSETLNFSQLWPLVHPKSDTLLPRGGHIVSKYKGRVNLWSRSAGKVDGPQLSAAGKEHYERCAKLRSEERRVGKEGRGGVEEEE